MSVVTETLNTKDELVQIFERNMDLICNGMPSFVNKNREKALSRFTALGFPTKKMESYKYTDLASVFNSKYNISFKQQKVDIDLNQIFKCDIPELDTNVVLILNGFYYNRQPALTNLGNGAIIGSFAAAAKEYPELVEKHFDRYTDYSTDGMLSLNAAFAQDGFFLYIPKGVVLEKPIQIINVLWSEENLLAQQRNLVILEENSEGKVLVCDHSLSPQKFVSNTITEISAADNAHLEYINMQNEHNDCTQISHTYLNQEQNSKVNLNTITLHGGMIRNNVFVTLNGEGCENQTLGLHLTDKNQHVDSFTHIDHAKPHCNSNQLFKGVMDDMATGVFNGKILVRRDAQKTLAYQKNSNLLLTNDAKMNSKPQLEIYADDVKCSHGSTVGQLDQNALFYLRARGINEREARMLLMYAFADEVLGEISIAPLRERIEELVDKRLRGELSRCNNCAMHCGKE